MGSLIFSDDEDGPDLASEDAGNEVNLIVMGGGRRKPWGGVSSEGERSGGVPGGDRTLFFPVDRNGRVDDDDDDDGTGVMILFFLVAFGCRVDDDDAGGGFVTGDV